MSDEEQLEKIQAWWQENGRAVIAGVIIAVAGVVGWQQWGAYQERQAEAAANAYMQFVEARESDRDQETVIRRGQRVLDEHGHSLYSAMAGLQLAQVQLGADNVEAAAETLGWVVENAADQGFRDLARLRRAQILYDAERLEDALAALEGAEDGPYDSLFHELRGDIVAAQGDRERARASYQEALADSDIEGFRRRLIEQKLTDVGGEVSG